MTLLVHLGRAALIFWVAAILLPAAVGQATAPTHQRSPEVALLGVSATADGGRDRLGELTAGVHGAEDDVRRLADRARLEIQRFIAQLP